MADYRPNFNMPDIWETVPDIARPLGPTMKQNMRFHGGLCPKKFRLDQIQYDRLLAIIKF